MEEYLSSKQVPAILKDLIVQLCIHKPEDAVSFMVEHLNSKYLPVTHSTQVHIEPSQLVEKEADFKSAPRFDRPVNIRASRDLLRTSREHRHSPSPTSRGSILKEEGDTCIQQDDSPVLPKRTLERRNAVSSEPTNDSSVSTLPSHPKSKETTEKLNDALDTHIMFAHLEEEERLAVFNSMFEVRFQRGDVIIKQGNEGDNFYVVEEGECDINVNKDGTLHHVGTVGKDASFGELALIYLCPRAATITAKTDVTLWAIDRATYRNVLMHSVIEKRKKYEGFLEKVPILEQLTAWERMIIADTLETFTFQDGEVIMREGEAGDRFYIIVEGDAEVYQNRDGEKEQISTLHASDYFGEIALLTNRPRSATVVAVNSLKCVGLDRDRFNQVLGPCEDILRRNMEKYNQFMASKI